LSLLRQLKRLLGADFRAHDPAAEDDLAFLGAHGWRVYIRHCDAEQCH
jgi:hypothetical protein